ncbi:hypothetical protein CsSME_00013448 [Camellia sinensis var. sinensis]
MGSSCIVRAGKAACHDPMYGSCYGIRHNCPDGCPRLCEVDCRLCKPYCACDKPGAVCQDPRFIGADGIMFYFHGKKDKDFCLVSDSEIHINAHFIGKRSKKGRDFTWVQSIGILFGPHQFYLGARTVAKWHESTENMLIQLNGEEEILIPTVQGKTWQSPETGLTIELEGLFEIVTRVVPITSEESRVHGYDVTEEDCFAHLELNFKFESVSKAVDGVLGQTYRPTYQSRVKMFASSHLFATDCVVSKFRLKKEDNEDGAPLRIECGSSNSGKGILCKR